ncbi:MAG TPA: O-antigen ligase family protein [Opitutaceae bacterium]
MNPAAPSTSAPWLDWAVAAALAACIAWTTLCLGGYRPETMVVPALVIAALVGALLLARAAGLRREAFDPVGLWCVPFLVYAAINVRVVSPVAWLGWADWANWMLFAAVTWIAHNVLAAEGPRRLVHAVVALAATISVGLAVYQRWFDPDWLMLGRTQFVYLLGRASGAFGAPNSQAALMVLLLPAALGMALDPARSRGGRAASAGLVAICLLGLVLTISRGAWFALALALTVWPLLIPGRSWRLRIAVAAGVLGLSLACGAAIIASVPSVKARFVALAAEGGESTRPIMWKGAWALFRDEPILGTGAGSYNILFERYRPAGFRDEPQWAHNDYLNTLSDYGLVGAGLVAGGFLWALARALRAGRLRDRRTRAIVIGVIAFGLSLAIDFHLKIPALAMICALALAECLRSPATAISLAAISARSRLASAAAAGVVGAVAFLLIAPHYRAEAERYGPRREIDWLAGSDPDSPESRRVVERGLAAFDRAVAVNPANAQAWSDRSYALALHAHFEPEQTRALGLQAEEAARRALALTSVTPEFWWRLGVALDMQGRWVEAGSAFAQALALAPRSQLAWYHQAYHFSLKPATHALARAAATTCLQLEPGHYPAQELLRTLDSGR